MSRNRPYRGPEPKRKRTGGGHVSVYDDIQQLINDEESEIEAARDAADAAHDAASSQANDEHTAAIAAADQALKAALDAADQAHEDAVGPLQKRTSDLETLREQVVSLSAQNDQAPPPADPTVPTSPAPTEDASGTSDSAPVPSSPSTPTDPASLPSSLSTDPAASTPATDADPIPLTSTTDLRGIDETQPVAVPLSTGEIKVVTVADVRAADDPDLNDDDLTPDQQAVRNSDLP